jgi:hypothetical protein
METCLLTSLKDIKITNFESLFHYDRQNRTGGDVAIYLRIGFLIKYEMTFHFLNSRLFGLKLHVTQNRSCWVGANNHYWTLQKVSFYTHEIQISKILLSKVISTTIYLTQ